MRPKTWPGADCGTDHELLMCKFQVKLKQKNKANQFPQYDFEPIPPIFKDNIRNQFEVLYLTDGEIERPWNELKELSGMNVKKTPVVQVTEENKLVEFAKMRGEAKGKTRSEEGI